MQKMLRMSAGFAIGAGIIIAIAGFWGIVFVYNNVARENIVTPEEASIPSSPVRGPLTLKAQADIIRVHTLKATSGKTFAEMPRSIPQLDDKGRQVVGKDGKPIMVDNAARNIWIIATTLTTALYFGILAYAFSAFAIFVGIVFICFGVVFCKLARQSRASEVGTV